MVFARSVFLVNQDKDIGKYWSLTNFPPAINQNRRDHLKLTCGDPFYGRNALAYPDVLQIKASQIWNLDQSENQDTSTYRRVQ